MRREQHNALIGAICCAIAGLHVKDMFHGVPDRILYGFWMIVSLVNLQTKVEIKNVRDDYGIVLLEFLLVAEVFRIIWITKTNPCWVCDEKCYFEPTLKQWDSPFGSGVHALINGDVLTFQQETHLS